MKKRIVNILRSIFISPELLFGLSIICSFLFIPNMFIIIGKWYMQEANWLVGVGINGGFLIYALTQTKQILFPINDSLSRLKGWPDYVLLKDTVLVAASFCGLAALSALGVYIFKNEIRIQFLGVIFLINLLIPVIAIGSLYLAEINVKAIIEENS